MNSKKAEGEALLEVTVMLETKLVTVAEVEVVDTIPDDVATIEKIPADRILSPLKVIWPLAVNPFKVPVIVPVGVRAIVIEYVWAVSILVPLWS